MWQRGKPIHVSTWRKKTQDSRGFGNFRGRFATWTWNIFGRLYVQHKALFSIGVLKSSVSLSFRLTRVDLGWLRLTRVDLGWPRLTWVDLGELRWTLYQLLHIMTQSCSVPSQLDLSSFSDFSQFNSQNLSSPKKYHNALYKGSKVKSL